MKTIEKIVLTGGPCAGKTTGMSWIVNNFTKRGWKVFVVDETATELITGGACPWEQKESLNYQVPLYFLQKAKENAFEKLAETVADEKVLIVCDRGTMDSEAYLDKADLEEFHKRTKSAVEMMSDYGAVFHLVTAAKGAVEFYTTANNEARKEDPALAVALDDKTINAWTGHPHLRVIDNSTDFEKKMRRLVTEIAAFLGEPEPFEIERKFLIRYPDLAMLKEMPNCQEVEILQTYLKSDGKEEVRVRQRGDGNTFIFTKTTKRSISGIKRIEVEKRLDVNEYCRELLNADPDFRQIRKKRYCITYRHSYLELDIYPLLWDDKAILEVELTDENESFEIPEFIEIIREVTDDPSYKNKELARIRK